jgi:hypothetical protein
MNRISVAITPRESPLLTGTSTSNSSMSKLLEALQFLLVPK